MNQDKKKVIDGVWDDLHKRLEKGVETYGTPLTTFNGRNSLLDAYEEVLDLAMYIKQKLMEDRIITEAVMVIINEELDRLDNPDTNESRTVKLVLEELKERIANEI